MSRPLPPLVRILVLLPLVAPGCGFLGDAPEDVTRRFWAAIESGDAEAARALALALERSRTENEPESTVYAVMFLAELEARRGDREARLRRAREMVELTDRPGSDFYRLWGHTVLLSALATNEEWGAALELASELRAVATAIPIFVPAIRLPAAQAHLGLGDVKNALIVPLATQLAGQVE